MSRLLLPSVMLSFTLGCEDLGLPAREAPTQTAGVPDLPGLPMAAAPDVPDALFDLGQALAFDPILSGNRDIACLSCHHPDLGTDDDLNLPEGVAGVVIPRNAPALFNLHTQPTMFWDSRVRRGQGGSYITPAGGSLTPEMTEVFDYGVVSAQAMFPVLSRDEMRGQPGENELADLADDDFQGVWSGLIDRLRANPEYAEMLVLAYPDTPLEDMSFAHAANAIAGFEIAAFESTGSVFERSRRGEASLSPAQERGRQAFDRAGCDRCHQGAGLSDFELHNTGLPQIGPGTGDGASGWEDFGAGGDDRYAFRTPQLTNTTLTGPWGHAGQYDDLASFLDHYRNPAGELRAYDVQREIGDPSLWNQHFADADEEIIARLDRRLRDSGPGGGPNGEASGADGPGAPPNGGPPNAGPPTGGPPNGGPPNAGPNAAPPTGPDGQGGGQDTLAILDFMGALEDPAARDLSWTVPDRVPSGLPVAP